MRRLVHGEMSLVEVLDQLRYIASECGAKLRRIAPAVPVRRKSCSASVFSRTR
jgi:hypothetical protein